jgi:hypothetical protein
MVESAAETMATLLQKDSDGKWNIRNMTDPDEHVVCFPFLILSHCSNGVLLFFWCGEEIWGKVERYILTMTTEQHRQRCLHISNHVRSDEESYLAPRTLRPSSQLNLG